MAEEKKPESASGGEVQGQGKDIFKLLGFVVMAFNLVGAGAGAFFTYQSTLGWHPPVLKEEEAAARLASVQFLQQEAPSVYTMDVFKANLKGEPVRAIELEVNVDMASREGYEELMDATNKSRVRDAVMGILHDKSFDDVETVQGKLFLKDQIAKAINSILNQGIVKDVYFTEFKIE